MSVNCPAVDLSEPRKATKRVSSTCTVACRMLACDGKRGLTAVLGLGSDPMQQERSTGNRLVMFVGIGEPHEEIPP